MYTYAPMHGLRVSVLRTPLRTMQARGRNVTRTHARAQGLCSEAPTANNASSISQRPNTTYNCTHVHTYVLYILHLQRTPNAQVPKSAYECPLYILCLCLTVICFPAGTPAGTLQVALEITPGAQVESSTNIIIFASAVHRVPLPNRVYFQQRPL